jgi:RecJ-like exonuclease
VATAAKIIQEHVTRSEYVRIVSHLDADGLSAASIMGKALYRMDMPFRIRIGKQLDEELIQELASEEESLIIFTDFGSGSLELIENNLSKNEIVILDHHQPVDLTFQNLYHVNPHLCGFDGSKDLSGSGLAYLVSKALDGSNIDLASLAIVGALGDIQDRSEKKALVNLNERIVNDAVDSGYLRVESDLIFYGRETRPIHRAIAYTTNPFIPGLSGEEDKCLGFLINLGIRLKDNDRWRSISDLSIEEKKTIFSEIAKHLTSRGFSDAFALSLIGTVYMLTNEDRWTPLRDAREYASLLNACGKMNKSGLGLAICFGSRVSTLDESRILLLDYKRTISEHLDWLIRNPKSINRMKNINVVNGTNIIDELMISTIASILSSSNFLDDAKPLIVYTTTKTRSVKISGRIPKSTYVKNNRLNLGKIFQGTSARFNGIGGGHDIAAGAKLPEGTESEFIKLVDDQVGAINSNAMI